MTKHTLCLGSVNIVTIGLLVLLAACGGQSTVKATASLAPTSIEKESTASPPKTDTPIPTATLTPSPTDTSTATIEPSPTPETIAGPDIPPFLVIPSGTPVNAWGEIPIMPGAIAGLEAYGGYYYSIEKPVSEVQQFYQQELGNAGWRLAAVGQAENDSLKLVFRNNGDQVVLSLFNITFNHEDPFWGFQAPASFVLIVP